MGVNFVVQFESFVIYETYCSLNGFVRRNFIFLNFCNFWYKIEENLYNSNIKGSENALWKL